MKRITQQVVDFVVKLRYEDLPQNVRHEAKRILLDSIGCALGGLSTEKAKLAIGLAQKLGGPAEATILGMGDRVACTNAAFANGELINALDYDAIIAVTHSTPCMLPTFLAVAEKEGANGRDLILATAIGHEIAARMAKAMTGLMEILPEGPDGAVVKFPIVHGSSKAVFGAIAGAGKILNLGKDPLHHAFGIGGTLTPMNHMPKWYNSPPAAMTKYAVAGWISQAGVMSVYLAQMGYTGIRDIWDGEDGFWKYSGSQKWEPEKATAGLGDQWVFTDIYYKPYPCNRPLHGGLDCFYQILQENELSPEEIQEMNLLLPPFAELPILLNRKMETHIDAQFCVAYVFAAAAHRVPLNLWQDRQTMNNPKILGFMSKVRWTTHPSFAKERLRDSHSHLAAVEVVTIDGRKMKKETKYSKGASFPKEVSLTDEDLVNKFKNTAGKVLSERNMNALIERLWDLENVEPLSEVVACRATF
jgi:2-methylcitrate dehydratase PrpD